jgi:uncharacterized membrane protein (UPF0136 family)
MNILFSIYAVLMLAGGYMGFAKAGSKMSLIMGIVSAVVIFLGVYLTKNSPQTGYGVIAGMTGLLVVTFLIRVIKTQQMMPSGMLLVLSAAMFVVSIMQFLKK